MKHIKTEVSGGIARLVLARPPLNVLNIEMMREMTGFIDSIAGETDLKALVVSGEGKAFSAGVDVSEHTGDMAEEMIEVFHGLFRVLNRLPFITVAAVQGAALGGGCELAVFCDIVLAGERASFGQPEIQVGVFPPVAAPIFTQLVGRNRALELLCLGDRIRADEALRIGLINKVFEQDKLDEEVAEFTGRLAALSAPVLALTKKAVDASLGLRFEAALDRVERIYLDELMNTEDANEGLNAFLEKRKPVWRNR